MKKSTSFHTIFRNLIMLHHASFHTLFRRAKFSWGPSTTKQIADHLARDGFEVRSLYTHPAAPPAQPVALTAGQRMALFHSVPSKGSEYGLFMAAIDATEAAHGIKAAGEGEAR